MSIYKTTKEKTVRTEVPILRCDACGKEFEDNEEGGKLASAHQTAHAPLIYLHPGSRYSDTVWVEESAVIRTDSPWEIKTSIYHQNQGRTHIEWEGPGWYLLHEYESWFRGEREMRKEFIHVDQMKSSLKEKFDSMAQDWRHYIDLQRKGRPT